MIWCAVSSSNQVQYVPKFSPNSYIRLACTLYDKIFLFQPKNDVHITPKVQFEHCSCFLLCSPKCSVRGVSTAVQSVRCVEWKQFQSFQFHSCSVFSRVQSFPFQRSSVMYVTILSSVQHRSLHCCHFSDSKQKSLHSVVSCQFCLLTLSTLSNSSQYT